MADSDDEYDRKRRDKFRGERAAEPYRGSERQVRAREDWQERDGWSRPRPRDYPGRVRDRGYSPSIEPAMKRPRTDYYGGGGGGGGGGGDNYFTQFAPAYHQPHRREVGPSVGGMGGGGADGQQPPMLSFKAFLATQDDNISDSEAIEKYNDYKLEFQRQQLNEFFVAHKDDEWFRIKYHPEDSTKRKDEQTNFIKKRVEVFMELLKEGRLSTSLDCIHTNALVKLLDTVVVKLEGGTEEDIATLDKEYEEKEEPKIKEPIIEEKKKDKSPEPVSTETKEEGEEGEVDGEVSTEKVEESQKQNGTIPEEKDEITTNANNKEDKDNDDVKLTEAAKEVNDNVNVDDTEDKDKIDDKEENNEKLSENDTKIDEKMEEEGAEVSEVKEAEKKEENEEKEKEKKEKVVKEKKRKRSRSYSGSSSSSSSSGSGSSSASESESTKPPGTEEYASSSKADIDKAAVTENEDISSKEDKAANKDDEQVEEDKKESKEDKKQEEEEDSKEDVKAAIGEVKPPAPLHKTTSIFLRSLPPSITHAEVAALCARYTGFLRVALADPQPERRWQRRGWVTFRRDANIKEICWALNNARLRECDLGAIMNRDLSRRIRPVSGVAGHKRVVRGDIRVAARVAVHMDSRAGLWSPSSKDNEDEDNPTPAPQPEAPPAFGFLSHNPILHNITDHLIEEASAEEDLLLGLDPTGGADDDMAASDGTVLVERDLNLIQVLDRIILYLRIVHSIDYYNHCEYPNEDEMPSRCGILHARGPVSPGTRADISQLVGAQAELRMANFLPEPGAATGSSDVLALTAPATTATTATAAKSNSQRTENEQKLINLALKNVDGEIDKFVQANTRELAKDKWLCPLSGKKFKGPDFVRKHIFNKHAEKIEEVKKEVEFFNNYLRDPKRPASIEHQQPKREEQTNSYGHQQSSVIRSGYGGGGGGGGYGASAYGAMPRYYQGYSRPHRGYAHRARGNATGGDYRPIIHYRDLDAPREPEEFI